MATPTSAIKDCQACKKRRIRCDRSVPSCHKCKKRGLDCPGYDPALRWANGIAVRGRFRGLNSPVISSQESLPILPSNAGPTRAQNQLTTTLALCAQLVPEFPDNVVVHQLLSHYEQRIAGLMVWLDSERNAYRRLVIPLSQQQPVLLLAILAISAEHLAAESNQESSFSKSARDKVILMITQQAQELTQRVANGQALTGAVDCETIDWMLASMLTLSSYEMVGPQSTAWQSHRHAARTLVNAFPTSEYRNHELYIFLKNQLSIYDILACTTSFDLHAAEEAILPGSDGTDMLFNDYLKLIHQVTLHSRKSTSDTGLDEARLSAECLASKDVRGGFNLAAGTTLMASGTLLIENDPARHDFTRLVDIYHHAGLLYSYRCLYPSSSSPTDVEYSVSQLFERIDDIEHLSAWVQNLPWPVFIAGTESHGNKARQGIVIGLYGMFISTMGFSHYSNVLQFLKEFWAADQRPWLDLAREWEEKGQTFIAV